MCESVRFLYDLYMIYNGISSADIYRSHVAHGTVDIWSFTYFMMFLDLS